MNAPRNVKAALRPLLETLRSRVELAAGDPSFECAFAECLAEARRVVDPSVTAGDVYQLLLRHILMADLAGADGALAGALEVLASRVLTGADPLLAAYANAVAAVVKPSERQTLPDTICQTLLQTQDPSAADRLGVVYTPPAIVRFLVEGADWLCRRHFGRTLLDPAVEVLDPATGTGAFVCEFLRYFSGQPAPLAAKYRAGLRANEVAVLPYYSAGCHIAAAWAAISGCPEEFPGLRLVDTLETEAAAGGPPIRVVLGNPPYNSHQPDDNQNNHNRDYPEIDRRIRETYVRDSTARKTKSYDMYVRFLRWASDYLDEAGLVALVTNRSFLESRAFDGFRANAAREFQEIRIVDLGGDVRGNASLSGATHNVFGIQTGVALSLLVRNRHRRGCRILYARRPEEETASGKLEFLNATPLSNVEFESLTPDAAYTWLRPAQSDFASFLPLTGIFALHSPGISTNRDEWTYGATARAVAAKMRWFIDRYDRQPAGEEPDPAIKWSRNLRRARRQKRRERFSATRVVTAAYRPFVERYLYLSPLFVDEHGLQERFFPALPGVSNTAIVVSQPASQKPFTVFAVRQVPDLHLVGAASGAHCLPLYHFEDGTRHENISGEALARFEDHYGAMEPRLSKDAIFHYVYAVLHDPVYREAYRENLKRQLPAIPFYRDFHRWAAFGAELLRLHTGYRTVRRFPMRGAAQLDPPALLARLPTEAREYRLAGRPALDWVLEQHRDRQPRHPSLREHFGKTAAPGGKAALIDLLLRVTTVSLETVRILREMESESTRR